MKFAINLLKMYLVASIFVLDTESSMLPTYYCVGNVGMKVELNVLPTN